MKRLLLLRHAKSSWDDASLADRDRPLAPRGHKAAERMAEHLRSGGPAVDLVLCSPALRTTETLELMNTLTYGGVEAAQYPLDIYARWFRYFLTFVVPLGCVSFFPVAVVLGRADRTGVAPALALLAPALGFVFLGVSLWAWRFGVRHYTSTGS